MDSFVQRPKIEVKEREDVLVCLIGLSPAVLTETLYALSEEDPPVIPHRVVVLTTSQGREMIKNRLFDSGMWESFLKVMEKRFGKLEGRLRFGFTSESIRIIPNYQGTEDLKDVRNIEDHHSTADFILRELMSYCEKSSVRLIASIAGGRKTMGALLFSVMGLIARDEDRICHVLVSEPWERIEGFLYPGCSGKFKDPQTKELINSRDAKLELADIPFIPLRYLLRDLQPTHFDSYERWVNQLREIARNLNLVTNIHFQTEDRVVFINGRKVELSAKQFAFLLYFASRSKSGLPAIDRLSSLNYEQLRPICTVYNSNDDFGHWTHEINKPNWDAKEDPRKCANQIRSKLKKLGFAETVIQELIPFRNRYSMAIDPRQITIN